METEWIKSIKTALEKVNGDPVAPSVQAMLAAILVAKGIVTLAELKEIEDYYNTRRE